MGRTGGIPVPHREVGCTSPSVVVLGTWFSGGCRPQTVPRNPRASGPVLRRLDCSAIPATRSSFFSQQRSSGSSSLCGSGHPNRQGRYQRRRLAIARVFLETRWVVFASANPLVSTAEYSSPAVSFLVCSPHSHYTIGRSPVSRPYIRLAAVFSGVVSSSAALLRTSASANRAGQPGLTTSSLDVLGSTFSAAVFCVHPRSFLRSNHFLPQPSAPRSTRETGGFSKQTTRRNRGFLNGIGSIRSGFDSTPRPTTIGCISCISTRHPAFVRTRYPAFATVGTFGARYSAVVPATRPGTLGTEQRRSRPGSPAL